MIVQLEDRWGTLAVLEYEHGAREALLALFKAGDLTFEVIDEADKETFIRETAAPYAAQSFRQAKEFFRHAETSSWIVKPLLLYYGMLTAVKAALVFDRPDFFLTKASRKHGLNRIKANAPSLISDRLTVQGSGVFQLARKALRGKEIPEGTEISINEILKRLPEVLVTYSMVVPGSAEKFWKTVLPWTATKGPGEPYRIVFDLAKEYADANQAELPEELINDFHVLQPDEKTNRYASKSGWNVENDARLEIERGQPSFLAPTLDGGAALILPISLNGFKHQLTEIELIYLITFYFSEIARYVPHFWLNLHTGAADFSVLLCQDVLRSCENKFLQLLQKPLSFAIVLTMKKAAAIQGEP